MTSTRGSQRRTRQAAPATPAPGARLTVPLPLIGWLLRLTEFAAICAASLISLWLLDERIPPELAANYGRVTLMAAILYLVLAESLGANDVDAQLSLSRAWSRVLTTWLVTAFFMTTLGFMLRVSEDFSRGWTLSLFALGAAGLAIARGTMTIWTRSLKRQGVFDQRAAIFGAGEQGARLAQYILGHDKLTLALTGFYDDRSSDRLDTTKLPVPLKGRLQDLVAAIRRGEIDQVIVALPWSADSRLKIVVEQLAMTPVRIRLAPDMVSFMFAQRPVVLLGEVPVMTLFERPISGTDQAVKWLEDRILAALALLILAPLLAVIAIAIKLDSKGPIFFKQPREGFNNQPFLVWKFRSMFTDLNQTDNIVQASRHDPRVTRVGAFLRRTSLDELPQLINVLTGSMSLVGPRPHAPSTRAGGRLFSDVVSSYAARHKVKPGITGWAQVNGWRGETDTEQKLVKRLEHDLYYIENWSPWFDLYILAKTAATVLSHKSAY